jgi:hypothetical protein
MIVGEGVELLDDCGYVNDYVCFCVSDSLELLDECVCVCV